MDTSDASLFIATDPEVSASLVQDINRSSNRCGNKESKEQMAEPVKLVDALPVPFIGGKIVFIGVVNDNVKSPVEIGGLHKSWVAVHAA